ncbi:MAG TPA: VapC toxin family PIN domain ribonuclease [Smithella sp.]|jgi:hypothetical protein|nr:VapC toxin family PIN domain ribonuclease [Smithella sp.]
MILVDTPVLIDYLRGTQNAAVAAFDKILEKGLPYGINKLIYLEILQGARTKEEFNQLREYFETIPFYGLNLGKESHERAAQMNMACRRSGITIRSTIDLLIAEIAIENDLFLLISDSYFKSG